jgi:IrrE N-terminal-like domain
MAIEYYDSNGLTQAQLARLAIDFRGKFQVLTTEYIDVVSILEFSFPEIFPGFRLHVVKDAVVDFRAEADIPGNRIVVKQFVYDAACEGDAESRFTLAHEMAHFILHQKLNTKMQKTTKHYEQNIKNLNFLESAERQADSFAMHFLIHPSYAYKYRKELDLLSKKTGAPYKEVLSASMISKRQEMAVFKF